MIPSTYTIMEKRETCRRRLRWVSFYLFLLGGMWGLYYCVALGLDFATGDSVSLYQVQYLLTYLAIFWVPALVVWQGDRWLVKRIVPFPDLACPRCDYQLKALTTPKCPECGLDLPASLISSSTA